MNWIAIRPLGVMLALALALVSARAQVFSEMPGQQRTASIRLSPDLAEVVKLTQAGKSDDEILAVIKLSPRQYQLSEQDIAKLKKLGVSSKIISALQAHDVALLEQWNKEAQPLPTNSTAAPEPVVPPKLLGRSRAQMRSTETPLVRLSAPIASTNGIPGKYRRPWTSSIIVEQPPPPPKLERRPKQPGPDYKWIPGNWARESGKWVWVSGAWRHKPAPNAVWMGGYWSQHGRGWIWVPGRWQ